MRVKTVVTDRQRMQRYLKKAIGELIEIQNIKVEQEDKYTKKRETIFQVL